MALRTDANLTEVLQADPARASRGPASRGRASLGRLSRRARFAGAVVIVLSVLLLVWNVSTARDGRTSAGVGLGADYLAFYNAADIVNRFGVARVYDLSLQHTLYHQRLPGEPADAGLPFVYPPYVAVIFAPLARVGYEASYVLWSVTSAGLYVVGVLMFCTAARLPRAAGVTALLAACAFEPFIIECLHGGQVSTVAFALIGLAVLLHQRGWTFMSGVALGCCVYKPTLLLVIGPALLLAGYWRLLLGCVSAMVGWGVVGVVVAGPEVMRQFLSLMLGYTRSSDTTGMVFRTWKFVDLNSFFKLLGAPSEWTMIVLLGTAGVIGWMVLGHARRVSHVVAQSPDDGLLFWALVLAWTPVANLYTGVYDSVLSAGSVLLMLAVQARRPSSSSAGVGWAIALWTVPWFSGLLAMHTGVQMHTLVLLGYAIYVSAVFRAPAPARVSVRSTPDDLTNRVIVGVPS